jgi:hypothetical protein
VPLHTNSEHCFTENTTIRFVTFSKENGSVQLEEDPVKAGPDPDSDIGPDEIVEYEEVKNSYNVLDP